MNRGITSNRYIVIELTGERSANKIAIDRDYFFKNNIIFLLKRIISRERKIYFHPVSSSSLIALRDDVRLAEDNSAQVLKTITWNQPIERCAGTTRKGEFIERENDCHADDFGPLCDV